ncbi:hypothetical protein LP414_27400 [Polaromonas sp. P1(28)-13]|nr:hypothetical protein LP414_27400 [Polaromonas sp. P1(28)-13]
MNLHIPPLGEELVLAQDWSFTLHNEHRNEGLVRFLKLTMPKDKHGYYDRNATLPVTLPAGTKLTIRRYYIRLGQKAFDSVTFTAKMGKSSPRFWAKLADANKIAFASTKDPS